MGEADHRWSVAELPVEKAERTLAKASAYGRSALRTAEASLQPRQEPR